MLKKLVVAAGVAAALGLAAGHAAADPSACADVYVDVNGTVVEQTVCVPPAE